MDPSRNVCSRCISDTSIPGIKFNGDNICIYCEMQDKLEKMNPLDGHGEKRLHSLIGRIKKDGRDKEYDCIIGISGGRDSTYTLYKAVELGLRPLAVHFDNGWNSEIAVSNIENATNRLGVDLHSHVADWEEFKDLQLSFLKASVSDAEVPTDYAIISVLYQMAESIGTRYVLNGHSFRTEGITPLGWTYMDGRYIRGVHKRFGRLKITSFPIMSMADLSYYTLIKNIKFYYLPEMLDYDQKEAGEILSRELGWEYYGGHHHENLFTYFFQSYLLPKKFGIDKRMIEYSALIRSGQMTRKDALEKISLPYEYDSNIVRYVISKLGLTQAEFDEIFGLRPRTFREYPSYYPFIKILKYPIKIACKLDVLPQMFYDKYLG
jgi:N-acetyl sugar amidotransferase